MKKLLHFFSKNIIYAILFHDQSFNDMLTNDIVSFEQLGPEANSVEPDQTLQSAATDKGLNCLLPV